ncbi:hypothetical protein ACHAXS_003153 [Conticribra weissflogii]
MRYEPQAILRIQQIEVEDIGVIISKRAIFKVSYQSYQYLASTKFFAKTIAKTIALLLELEISNSNGGEDCLLVSAEDDNFITHTLDGVELTNSSVLLAIALKTLLLSQTKKPHGKKIAWRQEAHGG